MAVCVLFAAICTKKATKKRMCINDFEHEDDGTLLPKGVGEASNTPPCEATWPETGVSSNSAPALPHPIRENNRKWFVMRAVYGQTEKAVGLLRRLVPELAPEDVYCPTYVWAKRVEGKLVKERRPYVPGLFFARLTEQLAFGAVRCELNQSARCLDFYRDRTQPANWNGVHPAMTVADEAMANFRIVADAECEDVFPTDTRAFNLKPGAHVRVTCGPFRGAEGRVCRIKGKQRVLVELEGVTMVASSYVPSYALHEVIDNR